MSNPLAIELHPLTLRSTDGQGEVVDIGAERSAVALEAVVTTCTGDLTLQAQTSPDGTTGWRDVGLICATSDAAKKRAWLLDCDRYVRAKWNVGTSATFSVRGAAYSVYAHREDLEDCLPSDVVEQADEADPGRIPRALINASSMIEAKLGTAHDLPLTEWQPVLAQATAQFAAAPVLSKHRHQGGGNEELVRAALAEAKALLSEIQTSKVVLPNATPDASGVGPQLLAGDPDYPDDFPELFSHSFGTWRSDF